MSTENLLHILIGDADRNYIEKPRPLVLDEQFTTELAQLNKACREIRAMGFQIEGEQIPLRIAGGRAEILLAPGQRLAPLLEKCQGRWFHRIGNRLVAHTEFNGVMVSWEELA